MAAAGDCTADQVGKLILPADIPEAFLRTLTVPAGRETSLEEDGVAPHHDIVKSGIYILLMSNCDAASFPVKISGQIVSMDPYGYLPGDLFGNLPFYGALSCLYGLLGVVWLVYCAMYSEQLMALQLWITFVLALGMVETTTLFLHYLMWNHHGKPTIAVIFVALFFGVSKRSVSRVVVLLVSLGYGVVRPTLGEEMTKVLYLGLAYFLLSLVYTVATSLPTGNHAADESEYDMLSMVVFVLAAVDTAFYVWILTALNNLLGGLAARKQAAKYILYRNFRSVLFVSLFATCVWVLYGSVINLNTGHGEDNNWKDHWTVDALWEMTYFMIFVAIAVMWAPSKNSMRWVGGYACGALTYTCILPWPAFALSCHAHALCFPFGQVRVLGGAVATRERRGVAAGRARGGRRHGRRGHGERGPPRATGRGQRRRRVRRGPGRRGRPVHGLGGARHANGRREKAMTDDLLFCKSK